MESWGFEVSRIDLLLLGSPFFKLVRGRCDNIRQSSVNHSFSLGSVTCWAFPGVGASLSRYCNIVLLSLPQKRAVALTMGHASCLDYGFCHCPFQFVDSSRAVLQP